MLVSNSSLLLLSDTYIELRLIKWLMGDNDDPTALEFVHVFNTTVTYKVTISDKSSPLILPGCFTIQGKLDAGCMLLQLFTLYTEDKLSMFI